jgi:hypothetical protein
MIIDAMKFRPAAFTLAVVLFCPIVSPVARADAQAQMMRALAAKYKPSLVTLSLIVKISSGSYADQSEMEAEGVLLDGTGLVVTTNNAVDPMAAYADESAAATLSSRVTSVKILTAAGVEIPAKVVLRDKDLNLAFIRPLKKPDVKLSGVSLQNGGGAQLGEPIYLLGRLGKTGNRSLEAKCERVVSVMEKPRRLYALDAYNAIYVGNVAFNEMGQPLGILTLRVPIGKARNNDSNVPVVIPARDVWELARQAPQARDVKDARPAKTTPAAPIKPASKKP